MSLARLPCPLAGNVISHAPLLSFPPTTEYTLYPRETQRRKGWYCRTPETIARGTLGQSAVTVWLAMQLVLLYIPQQWSNSFNKQQLLAWLPWWLVAEIQRSTIQHSEQGNMAVANQSRYRCVSPTWMYTFWACIITVATGGCLVSQKMTN